VNSAVPCPDRPFVAFGVWSITPYPYYGAALFGPVRPTFALGSLGLVAALLKPVALQKAALSHDSGSEALAG
jgi:hypothetical protein